jgi:hypothetical protein
MLSSVHIADVSPRQALRVPFAVTWRATMLG